MPRHKQTQRSDVYAPYGTCDRCGWEGKDWAFKYQGLCSDCYKEWRKAKAEERRRLKPANENVEVVKGVVVTTNVRERLEKRARSQVPQTDKWCRANWCEGVGLFLSLTTMFILVFTYNAHPQYASFLIICTVVGYTGAWVAQRVERSEEAKRRPEVQAHLEELARARQQEIEATRTFYASPEWRILREQVITEQGRRCRQCKRLITDDFELTVDHIKPRSKFPELALDKSNLRVLCRQCNSSKGDAIVGDTVEEPELDAPARANC